MRRWYDYQLDLYHEVFRSKKLTKDGTSRIHRWDTAVSYSEPDSWRSRKKEWLHTINLMVGLWHCYTNIRYISIIWYDINHMNHLKYICSIIYIYMILACLHHLMIGHPLTWPTAPLQACCRSRVSQWNQWATSSLEHSGAGKSPFFMGKSTVSMDSMAIFNSKLLVYCSYGHFR